MSLINIIKVRYTSVGFGELLRRRYVVDHVTIREHVLFLVDVHQMLYAYITFGQVRLHCLVLHVRLLVPGGVQKAVTRSIHTAVEKVLEKALFAYEQTDFRVLGYRAFVLFHRTNVRFNLDRVSIEYGRIITLLPVAYEIPCEYCSQYSRMPVQHVDSPHADTCQ